MKTVILLYLWTRLDVIGFIFGTGIVVCVAGLITCGIYWTAEEPTGTKAESAKKLIKQIITALVACIVLGTIFPSKKDAAIIFGGWAALEAVKSDTVQRVLGQSGQIIEGLLQQELDKLQPRKEEKK